MRQIVPLGLIIGGIALIGFVLLGGGMLLLPSSPCLDNPNAQCLAPDALVPNLVLYSGIALGIAGAVLLRRPRHKSPSRI